MAENVVRQAEVPVFVVRQKQHELIDAARPEAVPGLKHILCPVNRTEVARSALGLAASIAQRFGARLTALCVVEPDDRSSPSKTKDELCRWIKDAVPAEIVLDPVVQEGRATEAILEFIQEHRPDLVVLGARDRTSFKASLFGSTTELVLRHAPVPVLVTRHGGSVKK